MSADDVGGFFRRGTVEGTSTWSETHISSTTTTSGGGGHVYRGTGFVSSPTTSTTTSSTSVEVSRFFLKFGDDSEEEFKLKGGKFAVREGHVVSLVRVGPKDENWGYNLAFYNHSTRTGYAPEAWLEHPLAKAPSKALLFLAPIGGIILGYVGSENFLVGLVLGAIAFGFAFKAYSKRMGERRILIDAVRVRRDQLVDDAKAAYAETKASTEQAEADA